MRTRTHHDVAALLDLFFSLNRHRSSRGITSHDPRDYPSFAQVERELQDNNQYLSDVLS